MGNSQPSALGGGQSSLISFDGYAEEAEEEVELLSRPPTLRRDQGPSREDTNADTIPETLTRFRETLRLSQSTSEKSENGAGKSEFQQFPPNTHTMAQSGGSGTPERIGKPARMEEAGV